MTLADAFRSLFRRSSEEDTVEAVRRPADRLPLLIATMHAALSEAQAVRHKRPDLGWIAYERGVMFAAVQEERAKLGKAPVPLTEIERVERLACGHSDYTRKFALGCAELVLQ